MTFLALDIGTSELKVSVFNAVGDSMGSILDLAKTEGMLFKFGSGTGSNLSCGVPGNSGTCQ